MIKLGITGGIGCGKSTVGAFLTERHIPVLDTDHVTHALLAEDSLLQQALADTFGSNILLPGGGIDRKALGTLVFSAPEKRALLEGLVHPRVQQKTEDFLNQQAQQGEPIAAVLIPLLFEAKRENAFDVVWLIKTTEQQQMERLQQTRGLSVQAIQTRISSQLSFEEKYRRAQLLPNTSIIDNSGSLENTRSQVLTALSTLLAQKS